MLKSNYEGILISEQSAGKKSGNVEIFPNQMKFTSADGDITLLPLSDMQVSTGGAANRYLYFKFKSGFTFYTDDSEILNHADIKYLKDTGKEVKGFRHRKRLLWVTFSLTGVLLVLALVWFVFNTNLVIKMVVNQIPRDLELSLSQTLKEQALEGKKIIEDEKLMAELNKIIGPLLQHGDTSPYSFNFTVIEDSTINAFALPGGAVIIHSGLLQKAGSAEEIAGVLAHEISHVTLRHHMRGLVSNLSLMLIFRGLVGDITGISASLINAGATLGSLSYSRGFEKEADVNGLKILERSKINSQGMIDFFDKLSKEHAMPEETDFLSTHPNPGNRKKYLEKLQNDNIIAKKLDIDLTLIHRIIQQQKNAN